MRANSLRTAFECAVKTAVFGLAGCHRDVADRTHLEVERKYRLTESECDSLPEILRSFGFVPAGYVNMTDTFLPIRDDSEMLRVREEEENGVRHTLLTLKSWLRTPDGGKERQETETQISDFARRALLACGHWLSGSALLSFSKSRCTFDGSLSGLVAKASIDRVSTLGKYSGCYLEVEILVPTGVDVTPARKQIAEFVAALLREAREPVALSYRDMLKLSLKELG